MLLLWLWTGAVLLGTMRCGRHCQVQLLLSRLAAHRLQPGCALLGVPLQPLLQGSVMPTMLAVLLALPRRPAPRAPQLVRRVGAVVVHACTSARPLPPPPGSACKLHPWGTCLA